MPGRSSEGRGGGARGRGRGGRGRGSKDSKDGDAPTSTPSSGDDHAQPPQLTEESQLLARLRHKSISHPLQQCQLALYVPPHSVGAVIGRGGRTIVSVQREAMRRSGGHEGPVKIAVLGTDKGANKAKEEGGETFAGRGSTWNYNLYEYEPPRPETTEEPVEEDEWIPVVIRGDPVACFAAVRRLLPIVEHEHDPDIVFEVPIHRAKHNMLVGKGGIVIASLSATYDTRIMIPPNEFMSNVEGGGDNVWTQNAGSKMLFDDGDGNAGGGDENAGAGSNLAAPGMLPDNPNIIQLEGDIDNVEKCLVQMLSIVAGAKWTPLGVIVQSNVDGQKSTVEERGGKRAKDKLDSPKGKGKDKKDKEKDVTTAEATIVKVWTPSSKLLNLGKIRKVQRKTNTVIRRKKLRLGGIDGDGGKEEVVEEEAVEAKDDDNDEENDEGEEEEEEETPKDAAAGGAKTATKYIITGRTESVKAAAAQFEKILGLDPGSATIADTTHKTKGGKKGGGKRDHPSKKERTPKDPQSKLPEDEADGGVVKKKAHRGGRKRGGKRGAKGPKAERGEGAAPARPVAAAG